MGREIMVDKITFMETLHSVQEIAKASAVPLTKEEITSYFQDMDLSKEQQEMIYQFLQMPQEETNGETEQQGAGSTGKEGKSSLRSRSSRSSGGSGKKTGNPHFQMYLREISAVPTLEREPFRNKNTSSANQNYGHCSHWFFQQLSRWYSRSA